MISAHSIQCICIYEFHTYIQSSVAIIKFFVRYTSLLLIRYEMKRGADTGSIHGSIKMISSLKAKSIALQQQKKHSSGKSWVADESLDLCTYIVVPRPWYVYRGT